MRKVWWTLLIALTAWLLGIGVYWGMGGFSEPTQIQPNTLTASTPIGAKRPDFGLNDIDGRHRNIDQWGGKVLLINFWATWCPPCRKEIPGFMRVRDEYAARGFEIIGIAIDSPEAVKKYIAQAGVRYPVLIGQAEASQVAKAFGNKLGALPYSVLLDRDGVIRFAKAGELRPEILEAELQKYL